MQGDRLFKMTLMRPFCLTNCWKTNKVSTPYIFVPRRYRYKPKWAVNLKEPTNSQLALNNFDAFYKPYFGDLWPSIRVSLLSLPKYCAVLNCYGNAEKTLSQLDDLDISNFVGYARSKQSKTLPEKFAETRNKNSESLAHNNLDSEVTKSTSNNSDELLPDGNDRTAIPDDEDLYKDNLNMFVPTVKVYSEKDKLLREEISMNSFQPRDAGFEVLPCDNVSISSNIDAFVFSPGDISMFPQPKPHNRIHGYYLMDAASVMPVIALDVHPDDQVLDLCAAPGGKSFIILQSLSLEAGGTLSCNDSSQSRLNRLRTILNSHFPAELAGQVNITNIDGTAHFTPKYNKVLVDVPCNSDRHVVTENDNNLFKISRTRERLSLMQTQKQLLVSGIKACVPGGTVVYSTCTLSPAQNDGVIQSAIEELSKSSVIEVVVQDLSPLADLFSHVFKFHRPSRYGQLILPKLLNNFGPSYFAKLKRIK